MSTAMFSPTSADTVRQQIINQQDQIMAQVQNMQRNILVSIGSGSGGIIGSAPSGVVAPPPVVRQTVVQAQAPPPPPPQQDQVVPDATVLNRVQSASAARPVNGGASSAVNMGGPQQTAPQAFKASVQSQAPTAGSLSSSLNTGRGQGTAAIGFSGNRVKGETRLSPGSASSSVSASS